MLAYIDFPTWISPYVFGFLHLPKDNFLNLFRWYGMMYIIGILIAYFQTLYLLKKDNFQTLNKKIIDDYYFWGIIGLVLGGRIFSCLVYNFNYYSTHITEILVPYQDGKFIGYSGMAFHGAVIGVTLVTLLYVKIKNINFREICDLISPVIPFGYTFGRIANFINQELWGRITASPIGILFPTAEKMPINITETQTVVAKLGWKIDLAANIVKNTKGEEIKNVLGNIEIINKDGNISNLTPGINLPRHPSQLYEATFEGLILFIIIWFIARKYKPFKGFLFPVYLCGYALFRFFIEFFRQPDSQFADIATGKYIGFIFGNISMGQLLSILMFLTGIGICFYFYYLSKNNKTIKKNHKNK